MIDEQQVVWALSVRAGNAHKEMMLKGRVACNRCSRRRVVADSTVIQQIYGCSSVFLHSIRRVTKIKDGQSKRNKKQSYKTQPEAGVSHAE